jgi:hypothetical protein
MYELIYVNLHYLRLGLGMSSGTAVDPSADTESAFLLLPLARDAPADASDATAGAAGSDSDVPLPLPLSRRTKSNPECNDTAKGDDDGCWTARAVTMGGEIITCRPTPAAVPIPALDDGVKATVEGMGARVACGEELDPVPPPNTTDPDPGAEPPVGDGSSERRRTRGRTTVVAPLGGNTTA